MSPRGTGAPARRATRPRGCGAPETRSSSWGRTCRPTTCWPGGSGAGRRERAGPQRRRRGRGRGRGGGPRRRAGAPGRQGLLRRGGGPDQGPDARPRSGGRRPEVGRPDTAATGVARPRQRGPAVSPRPAAAAARGSSPTPPPPAPLGDRGLSAQGGHSATSGPTAPPAARRAPRASQLRGSRAGSPRRRGSGWPAAARGSAAGIGLARSAADRGGRAGPQRRRPQGRGCFQALYSRLLSARFVLYPGPRGAGGRRCGLPVWGGGRAVFGKRPGNTDQKAGFGVPQIARGIGWRAADRAGLGARGGPAAPLGGRGGGPGAAS